MELQKCRTQWNYSREMVEEKGGEVFFGEVDGGQGCCGVYREVVVAFMVIASQHPIVSGLSGRSNLGAEFVAFCTMTDQTYCHIQGSRGLCYTFMPESFPDFWNQGMVLLNICPCQ